MIARHGTSLFELLVVLAIIVMLSSISIPMLTGWLARYDDQLLQRQVLYSMELAQQTARAIRKPVVLCPTKDSQTCTTEPMTDLISFVDEYGDGVIHDRQQIIAIQQNKAKGQLYRRFFPACRDYFVFSPTGLMHSDNGTLWYCRPDHNKPSWAIVMNKAGRIRVANDSEIKCDACTIPLVI